MNDRTGDGKYAAVATWRKGGSGSTQTHTFFHDVKPYAYQLAKDWAFHNLSAQEWKSCRITKP